MQHFRKISTLSEDMAALGLTASEPAAKAADSSQNRSLRESSDKPAASAPKKKLKESLNEKRKLAKEALDRRLARRESTYKKRLQALVKLSESKNIVPRFHLRLNAALGRRAKVMESLDLSKLSGKAVNRAEMIKAFENVSVVAGLLARKFAVVEELMDASGIPVEHPASAYGYDVDLTNVKDGNKTGDATDYADGKTGMAGEVEEADDEWMDDKKKDKKDDMAEEDNADVSMDNGDEDAMPAMAKEDAGEDDDKKDAVKEEDGDAEDKKDKDDMAECQADDEMKEEAAEDSDDEKMKKSEEEDMDKKMEQVRRLTTARLESMPMDCDLNRIRVEAENMAAQVVTGTVGPVMAGSILNDMVSYLGGAMGLYQDLAKDMEKAYVGMDGPENDDGPAEQEKDNPEAYIGMEQPKGGSALDQGGINMSVPGKTDMAGGKSEAKAKPVAIKAKVEAKSAAKPAPDHKKK